MSDAIINKLIIVTQTPPPLGKRWTQNNSNVSGTPTAPNLQRQDTRLNEEMEHGLRSYEEELWSGVSFKNFFGI